MICFGMCISPEENQQSVLGGQRFFKRKVIIFIGRETKTHISDENQQKIGKVSRSNKNILLE